MKKKNIAGLIAIVAIIAVVMFVGCAEKEEAPMPTSTPTSSPSPTPSPTPTSLPEPKYDPGDIIAEKPIDKYCLMTIISYDDYTDEYEVNYIFRNRDGSWGHFVDDDTSWLSREFVEEYHPILIAHVDLSTITIGEPKVSPTPTPTPTFLFEGFDDINLFEGAYWEYSYEETSTYFNQAEPTKRGTMRIELVDSETWNLNTIGKMTFYRTKYKTISGDVFLGWPAYEYIAAKDGVIYIGHRYGNDPGEYGAAILFDSRYGKIYEEGFIGYFSANRKKSVSEGMINNKFIKAPAVVVSERYYKPKCETVEGVRVCGDEYHDYTAREYYLPHIGFGGFYRSGTSIYSGGGYVDKFTFTMNVGLTDTNVI